MRNIYIKKKCRIRHRYALQKSKLIMLLFIIVLISMLIDVVIKNDMKKSESTLFTNIINKSSEKEKLGDSKSYRLLCSMMIQQLGKPYEYGKVGPASFDCSGLVKYLFSKIGIYLPRDVSEQSKAGILVKKSDLKFGDIVFFSKSGLSLSHEGIYLGDGYFLHAPKTGDVVKISTLTSKYYTRAYKMAIRVLPLSK